MTNFDDHFSRQAREYALYRPHYPPELFAYLASVAPRRQLAWDCGTGNGQAARELVRHFNRVVATDASSEQLTLAIPHERIDYRVERAEEVSLEDGSIDLTTVAIAAHWFDLEQFYTAVRRVAVKNGILAVWTYHMSAIEPAVDGVLVHYYSRVLAGYWPERFHYVEQRYQTLPLPFEQLDAPQFEMQSEWDLEQLVGFLESWSATQRYMREHDQHPVRTVWSELEQAWGEPGGKRMIRWPLYLKVGRV